MIEEFLRFLINLSYFSFINEVVRPINAQNGDLLPVSAFKGYEEVHGHKVLLLTKSAV